MTKKFQFIPTMLPFIAFIMGYAGSLLYVHSTVVDVPSIVGKNVHDAAILLGEKGLGLKILSLKEDACVTEGTIISQIPTSSQQIKSLRAVLVIVSKKPNLLLMPDLYDKTSEEVAAILKELQLQAITKTVCIESKHADGKCFAQFPSVGNEVADQRMTVYVAKEAKKMFVMPSFIGITALEVQEYLQREQISYEVFKFSEKIMDEGFPVIIDQKPMAGTIITLDKLHVQLHVGFS